MEPQNDETKIFRNQKKTQKTEKTGEMVPEEGIMELTIPG